MMLRRKIVQKLSPYASFKTPNGRDVDERLGSRRYREVDVILADS